MPIPCKPGVEINQRLDTMLVIRLLREALSLFDIDRHAARQRIKDACALLRVRIETRQSNGQMLAGRKIRRAEEFIRNNLGSNLKIHEVARSVRLSTSYFSRAFKTTVGMSYSDYVTKSRLDLAKRLLLTSESPIAEIAYTCGLADQSHLTRLFTRVEGLPPRAWQRMVRDVAAQPSGGLASRNDEPPVSNAAVQSRRVG